MSVELSRNMADSEHFVHLSGFEPTVQLAHLSSHAVQKLLSFATKSPGQLSAQYFYCVVDIVPTFGVLHYETHSPPFKEVKNLSFGHSVHLFSNFGYKHFFGTQDVWHNLQTLSVGSTTSFPGQALRQRTTPVVV